MFRSDRSDRSGRHTRTLPLSLTVVLGAVALLLAGCSVEGAAGDSETDSANAPEAQTGSMATGASSVWPVADVAAEVEPSVVQVNVEAIRTTPFGPQEASGSGSGVIYREDGYIITNAHVVEGARSVNVAFADGTVEQGRVVGTDSFTDLAVIKVDRAGLPAAEFATDNLWLGELAVAVGSPSGFESTVTAGVVSGLGREIPPQLTGGADPALVDLIQTDAAISPGSSGGALANRDGEVIGINVAYLPPQTGAESIGFAIPAETAASVAEQLIEDGDATHPYMGVSLVSLTPEIAERFALPVESGALVASLQPGSPADEAGIQARSVITAVGSEEVQSAGDVLSALREYSPGEEVEITVVQDGEARDVSVELQERD